METATNPFFETEFVNTELRDDIDRRMTRWIVLAGDRTPPEFKRRFDGMKLGGEYLGHEYKTLAPSKGLLRRCQLTPMILGHDDVNPDELGDDKSRAKTRSYFDEVARQNIVIYYFDVLPGDEISGLFQICQGNNDYGIREIESLRGIDPPKRLADGSFSRCKAIEYQYEIFPEWNAYVSGALPFFKTTRDLDAYLRDRKPFVSDECAEVIDVLLDSNAQFERWATTELSKMSVFVKAPPTSGGKVYTWEKQHIQWFDDLDLNREEFLQQRKPEAETVSNSPSVAEFNEMKSMLKELTSATLGMARANAPTPQGETVEKRVCSANKANGDPCKSFTVNNTDFCVSHQPKSE